MVLITEKFINKQRDSLTAHSKCALKVLQDKVVADQLLVGGQLGLIDAVRLSLELSESLDGCTDLPTLRRIISIGSAMLKAELHSISFEKAVTHCLQQKKQRSPRTLRDIKETMACLMRCSPHLAGRSVRQLSTADCELALHAAFAHSPSRFVKARANLSGVFTLAYRMGWCGDNPVRRVHIPSILEHEIVPLSIQEIKSLFITARLPKHVDCLPALALMLYAGVRPEEMQRLHWDDIDWEERVLYMAARHCKTGGGRHVPLAAVLVQQLRLWRPSLMEAQKCKICPKGWPHRWRALRLDAGFDSWVPDVLRHSYASYHAKYFKDLPALQLSMGHRDARLLLTRYINLRHITRADAKRFWRGLF